MPTASRRTVVAGVAGALGALAGGSYLWSQYTARHHLRFRPLRAVNESDESVTLSVTVARDLSDGQAQTYDLDPAGDDRGMDAIPLNGPWIKRSDEYSVRVRAGDEELVVENREIIERLGGTDWGSDCARVAIVVTPDGTLESRVAPSEVC